VPFRKRREKETSSIDAGRGKRKGVEPLSERPRCSEEKVAGGANHKLKGGMSELNKSPIKKSHSVWSGRAIKH